MYLTRNAIVIFYKQYSEKKICLSQWGILSYIKKKTILNTQIMLFQDYRCPYCASGFIEQLESEAESSALSGDDFSDADMSNLDDSDDLAQVWQLLLIISLTGLLQSLQGNYVWHKIF